MTTLSELRERAEAIKEANRCERTVTLDGYFAGRIKALEAAVLALIAALEKESAE